MPLSDEEWRRVTQRNRADNLALTVVESSLPVAWSRMSPYDLMTGAAIIALHYDRTRMAEALRSRVIFNEHSELLPPTIGGMPEEVQEAFRWVAGQVELTVLKLADQIESGEVGHAH